MRSWWCADDHYDPMQTLRDMGDHLAPWFPDAFQPCTSFEAPSAFQHAFAGLVMLADWLGSDRGLFPYSEPDDGDRMIFARKKAVQALHAIGLDHGVRPSSSLGFDDLFSFPPNALQKAVEQLELAPLLIMESETGSGKTEAALWYFKRLFEAGKVDGLYFALPTRAAATQLHDRVRKMVSRLFPPDHRPATVLAVPGYFKVDDIEGRPLPGFNVLWDDDPDKRNPRFWAAENPKRYLAARIAVGTIDQVLISSLMVKHAHLRSTALMRHLLVVDEVHASDPYMNRLLEAVLDHHLGAGGYALLMSATLGTAMKARLLGGARAEMPSPLDAIKTPYPLLTVRGSDSSQSVAIGGKPSQKTVNIELSPHMEEPEMVASRALAAARAGAKILVVRNTVNAAVATQQALESLCQNDPHPPLFRCENVVSLHHGRFAREDRKILDACVEKQIGRERPDGGLIIIGTQTLEQSLDIDADLLISDLCPMDILLQRLGRLHRHKRDHRPAGFETARAIILHPGERDLSPGQRGLGRYGLGGYVYPDLRAIEATLRLLEQHECLQIPAMNRELVERATHPALVDALADELGPVWKQHGQDLAGQISGKKNSATSVIIRLHEPFRETQFPGKEERITTRLGAQDRLVDWGEGITPPHGPFGAPAHHLVLPAYLCGGIAPDAIAAIEQADGTGVRFRLGGAHFTYDRWGLRKED